MKTMKTIAAALAASAVLVTASLTLSSSNQQDGAPPALPPQPNLSPVLLRVAQPFELDQPATHWYRSERPQYRKGTLLVLSVPPDLVEPRQSYEPVLYVGDQTAQRVNAGSPSGMLVAIVPGQPDLTSTPIYFGDLALPETIDQDEAEHQLAEALAAGVQPASATQVDVATRDPMWFADDHELLEFASYLVEEFAPDEVDLITSLRAPLITR